MKFGVIVLTATFIFSPSAVKLNADCPLVRNHICVAYAGLIQIFVEAKQSTLARQTKDTAKKSYGCAADLLDKALPEPTVAAKP